MLLLLFIIISLKSITLINRRFSTNSEAIHSDGEVFVLSNQTAANARLKRFEQQQQHTWFTFIHFKSQTIIELVFSFFSPLFSRVCGFYPVVCFLLLFSFRLTYFFVCVCCFVCAWYASNRILNGFKNITHPMLNANISKTKKNKKHAMNNEEHFRRVRKRARTYALANKQTNTMDTKEMIKTKWE